MYRTQTGRGAELGGGDGEGQNMRQSRRPALIQALASLCIWFSLPTVHCSLSMRVQGGGKPRRKYLGVCGVLQKGKIKHWCAKMHGQILGVGCSPEEAARIVCRMGCAKSIEELVIPASVRCPRSVARFAGVWWRKPGAKSSGGWWVDRKAYFQSKESAIAFAVKKWGLSPSQLRKPVAPRELCARIHALCPVVDAMPWDIEDLLIRTPIADAMCKKVPVLMPLFIQAKLGPWRALMEEAWHAIVSDPQSAVHGPVRSLSEEMKAEVARTILIRAVRGMARNRVLRSELNPWNELNLGVQHHSGFLAMCLRLDIIDTGGHLDLGTHSSKYKLVDNSSMALEKLQKLSSAWASLSSVLCVPKTCTQWRRCMLDGMEKLYDHSAPGLNPNNGEYLPTWTLRCYLLMTARREGVARMKWDLGVRALGQMNPDQKEWFSTLEQHVKTTKSLRELVGTSCPPELLSCQLCLLSNKALDAYDSEWMLNVRTFIRVVASVGAYLRKGLRKPTADILKETAALLRK